MMDIEVGANSTFVHLDPGEVLHEAVINAFEESDRRHSVISTCIGSVRYIDYGVAACDHNGTPGPGNRFVRVNDASEIGSIQGHIGIDVDNNPSPHIHGVLFGPSGESFGGHVFEARVLITIEFSLTGTDELGWKRVYEPILGSPPLPLLKPVRRT
jgi:predicted DNA-binding protein with PD1-like motif